MRIGQRWEHRSDRGAYGSWAIWESVDLTLMLGKIEGRRRREQQRFRWFDGITDLADMSLSKLGEIVKDRGIQHAAVHKVSKT